LTKWKVALSDIDLGADEAEAVTKVLGSKWLTMGGVTRNFENAFAEYCGVDHAIAVTNGTAALHLAHWALGIGEGDQVVCPSLTFVATANAIVYCNATPVFADLTNCNILNVSPESIRGKITKQTRCITVMHYAGYPCEMEEILSIAEEYGLAVIEDACHAIGTEYNGKKCGTIGDIGCFSFFSNKNMMTAEGGMVVTDNSEVAQKIRLARSHGMIATTSQRHQGHDFSYDVVDLGFNYRIDEIRSAIGQIQLEKLDNSNKKRWQLTRHYQEKLSQLPGLVLPFENYPGNCSYHILPVLLPEGCNRSQFMLDMESRGIQTSMHYPPVHRFQYYQKHFKNTIGSLPVTEEVSEREVTLPLHPLMTLQDVEYVYQAMKEIYQIEDRVFCHAQRNF